MAVGWWADRQALSGSAVVERKKNKKIRAGDPISVRLEPAHPFMAAWWLLESLVVFSAAHNVRTLNQMHAAGTGQMASEEMR